MMKFPNLRKTGQDADNVLPRACIKTLLQMRFTPLRQVVSTALP